MMFSDRDATERLTRWVREHGGVLKAFLATTLRSETEAERGRDVDDLLQEVFVRAWEARERYRDQGSERSYLFRIADRLACDHLRRRGRERPIDPEAWRRVEPAASEAGPVEVFAAAEADDRLREALDRLSEPQRRTLLLRYFGNLEFSEIGRVMQTPVNTVLSHGRRGLLMLRKLLEEKPA